MENFLKENERIDDLEFKGLKIIQDKTGFCFGIDAVLLSDFAKDIKKDAKVVDLGTGTGIISILLSSKTKLSKIIGVEVQKNVADMANRSVKLNNLEDKIEIYNANIKQLKNEFEAGSMDAIVTNPPYKKNDTGILNVEEKKLVSRHEIKANLEDFIEISSYLLRNGAPLYMIHRPERLAEIFNTLKQYNLEPKVMRLIYPKINKEPNLVLIKATKGGKEFLKVLEPLVVYDENGKYTNEILQIYGKERIE